MFCAKGDKLIESACHALHTHKLTNIW